MRCLIVAMLISVFTSCVTIQEERETSETKCDNVAEELRDILC